MQLLISLLIAFFLFLAAPALASPIEPQKDSTSSTLTLRILPAVEITSIAEEPLISDGFTSSRSAVLGIRANTSWALEITAISSGTTYPLQVSGQTNGTRNLDNNVQEIPITITQEASWADSPGVQEVQIIYSAAPAL